LPGKSQHDPKEADEQDETLVGVTKIDPTLAQSEDLTHAHGGKHHEHPGKGTVALSERACDCQG
jgi:hypothetical protein